MSRYAIEELSREALDDLEHHASAGAEMIAAFDRHGGEHAVILALLRMARGRASVEWIPVTERLPEPGELVLLWRRSGRIDSGSLHPNREEWRLADGGYLSSGWVTHWRTHPGAPQGITTVVNAIEQTPAPAAIEALSADRIRNLRTALQAVRATDKLATAKAIARAEKAEARIAELEQCSLLWETQEDDHANVRREFVRRIKEAEAERDKAEAELRRAKELINRDRTGLAAGLNSVRRILTGYHWIPAGEWGSYDYTRQTQETLRTEVGHLIDECLGEINKALRESGLRADAVVRGTPYTMTECEARIAELERWAIVLFEDLDETEVASNTRPIRELWTLGQRFARMRSEGEYHDPEENKSDG